MVKVNSIIWKIFLKHLDLTQELRKTKKLSILLKREKKQKFIINLNGSKATPVGDIPTDMLKQTIDTHLPIMTQMINISIDNDCYPCFPDDLRLAEFNPVFKKKDDLEKENYRAFSVLSRVPKVHVPTNYVPTNRRFHERQIVKSFNRL